MAIKIQTTKDLTKTAHIKMIVYGQAGIGKTPLLATAKNPIIISTEQGLLSLKNQDVPYITVSSQAELEEAIEYVTDKSTGKDFDTICVDSLSDFAEMILEERIKANKNGQAAYLEMYRIIRAMLLNIRDTVQKDVVFVCKVRQLESEELGYEIATPELPGQQLPKSINHWFDCVFAMRTKEYNDKPVVVIQTSTDEGFFARDRSGELKPIEKPDLKYLINKIKGNSVEPSKSTEK